MICFDCKRKKLKGIPVLTQVNGNIKMVCWGCWSRDWAKWMPETREKLKQGLIRFGK